VTTELAYVVEMERAKAKFGGFGPKMVSERLHIGTQTR
jgi:hypothetical protein